MVRGRTGVVTLGAIAAAATLAACGGGSPGSTTTSTSGRVRSLAVTPAVRAALLVAGARNHGLPVTDFTGLAAGRTYYAYDPSAKTYWAGAALVPSRSSMVAQVSVQDDGAYDLFVRPAQGSWVAYEDGLGTVAGSHCAIVVPSSVRAVWGWSTTTPCGGPLAS